jgi:hypothetical protein
MKFRIVQVGTLLGKAIRIESSWMTLKEVRTAYAHGDKQSIVIADVEKWIEDELGNKIPATGT